MSGHSKWAQIKHKKAATDAKRGKLFSRLSKMLTIAAKEGGPDPASNSRLTAAIEEAKKENLPKDNIERAVKRASEKDAGELKEVLYEIYGPGGTAIIIHAVTDNSNRTTNEIKHLLSEHGAKLGEKGSAAWAFERKGAEWVAKFPLALSGDDAKKFETLLEILGDHDDIQEIYSNAELS